MRVLILTQRLPYAPVSGDRLRAFQQIHYLRTIGWTVDVLALVHDRAEAREAEGMRLAGHRVEIAPIPHLQNKVRGLLSLVGSRPLTLSLLDSPALAPAIARLLAGGAPDVLLACSSSMAAVALRPPLASIPLVIDLVDVDSEKWLALSAVSRWPQSWIYRREHRTLQKFEAHAAAAAYASVLTTNRELDALRAFAPNVRAEVLPSGIDLPRFRPTVETHREARVVFTGVMNYPPNADAAQRLARDIWPLVRSARPDACLDIVGAAPTAAVRRLQRAEAGITVTGRVPDVRPYLWRARVAVAPLRVARGIQTKVLEAAAAGLACVVTSPVRDGLPESVRRICPVADTPQALAGAIVRLLEQPPDEETCRQSVAEFDAEIALERLPTLLTEAANSR